MVHPADPITSELVLIFVLGMRHGLDPDHLAVIDNLVFRATVEQRASAPWIGLLFSLGHSVSVAAVAVGVSLFVQRLPWPGWQAGVFEWLAIALLILMGTLNMRALLDRGAYTPQGWRQHLAPKRMRDATHPVSILLIGLMFGFVPDATSQAVAWGVAAAATTGVAGAAMAALSFSAGMVLTDAADSLLVARLVRTSSSPAKAQLYRRVVGWLIVALSFGMSGYWLGARLLAGRTVVEVTASAVGLTIIVGATVLLLSRAWLRRDAPAQP